MLQKHVTRLLWWVLYFLNIGIIVTFWYAASGNFLTSSLNGFLTASGDLLGLLGAYSLLWQLTIMSRLAPLEAAFGRLHLTLFHRYNGYIAFSLLILHPIFLTFGYKLGTEKGFWSQFLTFVTTFKDVFDALIALILLIILVSATVTIVRKKLKYEAWYFIHLCSYLIIILAFSHQTAVGSSFVSRPLFVTYWDLLYLAVAGFVAYFRLLTPLYRFYRHRFFISEIKQEAQGVVSIYISGNHMEEFRFQPGQFARWRFLSRNLWWQMHPFSFSQAYDGQRLRLTVKGVGDYTKQLPALPLGTRVLIDGPHGIFTPALRTTKKVLLIAGGIGITPLYCMLDSLIQAQAEVTLLYSCRTVADIAFREELERMRKKVRNLSVYFLTEQDADQGTLQGRIDELALKKLVPGSIKQTTYVCGPPPMMNAITTLLINQGAKPSMIYSERFAY